MTYRAEVLALLLALLLLPAGASARAAAPDLAPAPAEIGPVSFQEPQAEAGGAPAPAPAAGAPPRGNPLWSIPLEALQATRERPLFSPSRRPAELMVAAAPAAPPPPRQQEARMPELRLTLVGTAVRDGDGYGIFLDSATNSVVRLKPGSLHDGWVLEALDMRQARMRYGATTRILTLPDYGADGLAQPKDPARAAAGDDGRQRTGPLPR